jgi:hypothetical protein
VGSITPAIEPGIDTHIVDRHVEELENLQRAWNKQ